MADQDQKKVVVATVDAYIAQYEGEVKAILEQTRALIKSVAPKATEKISWGMPTYHQGENLIHFAAAKAHLGLYPGPDAMALFAEQLKDYKTSKGAIQFPYRDPIPYALIEEIARHRVKVAEGKR